MSTPIQKKLFNVQNSLEDGCDGICVRNVGILIDMMKKLPERNLPLARFCTTGKSIWRKWREWWIWILRALFDPFWPEFEVWKSGRIQKIVLAQGECDLHFYYQQKNVSTRHVEVVKVETKEQFFNTSETSGTSTDLWEAVDDLFQHTQASHLEGKGISLLVHRAIELVEKLFF